MKASKHKIILTFFISILLSLLVSASSDKNKEQKAIIREDDNGNRVTRYQVMATIPEYSE